jgi:transcription elongation GreA/GreB family factor
LERYYTTPEGYKRFVNLMKRVAKRYDAVVASNPEAAEAGDTSVWHDNFAYEENQRQMHQWSRRLRDLERVRERLEVVEPEANPEMVNIGSEVVVFDLLEEKKEKYIIAGYEDGDPSVNRISYNSPLAQALLGAGVGDVREFRAGGKVRELEVVCILGVQEDKGA